MRRNSTSPNVLVYRVGSLGDTVVALPALRLIARAFPDATRTMLTNFSISSKAAPVAEVLENTGLIHDYIEYPINLRNLRTLWTLRKRIRACRADTLIYLAFPRGRLKAMRDAIFFHACGIKNLIGVPYASDQQCILPLGNGMYEYEGARLLRCIASLGRQELDAPGVFDLAFAPAEQAIVKTLLAPLGVAPILVASIGAKTDVKDWEDNNWRELILRLATMLTGWTLVMIGAPVERERSDALLRLWPGPALNLCGEVRVRVSAAVLSYAKLYIGHDSGPMHLAAAVGTPCVAIFSSQNPPGEWFPFGKNHRVLYHQIDCQGCGLEVCTERNKACIRSITVGEVAASVESLASELSNGGN
jgi:heptosyltransferase III